MIPSVDLILSSMTKILVALKDKRSSKAGSAVDRKIEARPTPNTADEFRPLVPWHHHQRCCLHCGGRPISPLGRVAGPVATEIASAAAPTK